MKIRYLLLVSLLNICIYAQEFGFGVSLDSNLYANTPTAVNLMRGDYDNLPKQVSLKQYCPTPGNQGSTSTCAGWSSAYAGRTILDAIRYNWTGADVDKNAFSPSFIYNQIRTKKGCNGGTSLVDALDALKNSGCLKLNEFAFDCDREVAANDKLNAANYRIIEYRDIVGIKVSKIKFVKKALAEKHPVIVAFDCPPSFMTAKEVLTPDSSEYKYWGRGHGIAVVGYDDGQFGGAFELQNSWGTKWGNGGYIWVKYSDFDRFCMWAFELIDKTIKGPDDFDLNGTMIFREDNGSEMKGKFNKEVFTMNKSYPAGTLFELRISNNEPAYVYSFSSDLTNKTYKIFPFNQRMCAYLPYSQNNIAIPDEESYNMLDEVAGTSYYCFLYSKTKLDIDEIITGVEKAPGTFKDKVESVLKDNMVNAADIEYSYDNKIIFKAKSKGKSVVPVIVEIKHTK